jgi:hypothetical protein
VWLTLGIVHLGRVCVSFCLSLCVGGWWWWAAQIKGVETVYVGEKKGNVDVWMSLGLDRFLDRNRCVRCGVEQPP